MNVVILSGNLTRDIEVRSTANGSTVANFGLANNRRYKVNGEQKEETTFVDMEAWGGQAEVLAKYKSKGDSLTVRGRLRLDTWEDKSSGSKRNKILVVVEDFDL